MNNEIVFGKMHCLPEHEMTRKNRPELTESCVDPVGETDEKIQQSDSPNPRKIGDHFIRPARPVCLEFLEQSESLKLSEPVVPIHFSTLPERLKEIEEKNSNALKLLIKPSNSGLNDRSRLSDYYFN